MDGGLVPARPEELDPNELFLPEGVQGGGMLFVGNKGKMLAGCYSANARLLPMSRMEETAIKNIAVKYPRVPGAANGHYAQWVEACLQGYGKGITSSPFDKAAMVVENMLVANLALRGYNVERVPNTAIASTAAAAVTPPPAGAGGGRGGRGGAGAAGRPAAKVFPARGVNLIWDHANMKITNVDEVNQFVKREYREGWHLSGV